MVRIHIPRACTEITTDFVKEFFKQFSLVENVEKSGNEYNEAQFHIQIKEWNDILQVLFQTRQARICYEDEGPRPSYFICNLL